MTKKILGSSDYRLNISCPSGPLFGLKYDATMSYTLFNDDAATMTPAFDLGQQVVVSPTQLHHPLKKATIIDIPFKHRDTYKIKLLECNSIFDILRPIKWMKTVPHCPTHGSGIKLAVPFFDTAPTRV